MKKHIKINSEVNIVKHGTVFQDQTFETWKFRFEANQDDVEFLRKLMSIMEEVGDEVVGINIEDKRSMFSLFDAQDEETTYEVEGILDRDGSLMLSHEGDDGMILDCFINIQHIIDQNFDRHTTSS